MKKEWNECVVILIKVKQHLEESHHESWCDLNFQNPPGVVGECTCNRPDSTALLERVISRLSSM